MDPARRFGGAAASRHDIRATLNHIAGYAELLRADAELAGRASFASRCEALREAAFSLVASFSSLMADEPPGPEAEAGIAAGLRSSLDALVEEVEGLVPLAGEDAGAKSDLDRILAAARQAIASLPAPSR